MLFSTIGPPNITCTEHVDCIMYTLNLDDAYVGIFV